MTQAAYRKYLRDCDRTPKVQHFINVTDHALVRWMERIAEFDIDAVRVRMKTHLRLSKITDTDIIEYLRNWMNVQTEDYRRNIMRQCRDAAMMGAVRLRTADGVFVIMRGTVVTVLT